MKKGQISMEFIFAIGVVIFMFFMVLIFSIDRTLEIRNVEKYIEMNSECLKLSNLISSSQVNGDGIEIHAKNRYIAMIYDDGEIVIENKKNLSCFYNANLLNKSRIDKDFIIKNKNNVIIVENV